MSQIISTYKCNFACKHCLFTCSPRKKKMIDRYSILDYLDYIDNDFMNFCGGEIFLHPDWEWQIKTLADSFKELRIVTNGSLFFNKYGEPTEILNKLSSLLEESYKAHITLHISNDYFHQEMYDNKKLYPLDNVIKDIHYYLPDNIAFTTDNPDNREIYKLGRAIRSEVYTNTSMYLDCNNIFDPSLAPDGNVYGCCNMKMLLGRVTDGYESWYNTWKSIKKPNKCSNCKL